MRPGLYITSLSDSLFKSLFRILFRYDIFISYARGDGKEYAVKLRDQLKQLDFSCFLDFDELPAGNSLNNTLKRAIKKSATLVVVGTERAVKSRYVELEVGEFSGTGRAIIPIDIEGTLVQTPWRVIKERDIVWIDEVKAALAKGVPSPNVADSIDKLFKYTRRNSRVRAQVLSTIVLFVVVVVAALFMIRQQVNAATLASAKAERETIEANKQKVLADAASVEADTQRKAADRALNNAKIAEGKAEIASNKATIAEKAASDAAREAKRQEQIALTNAEKARAEQAKAEERTRYVLAQQVGAQADIARDTGKDLDRSVLLSIESLKGAMTPEGYIAWERALDLLPHPVENSSGAIKMWDTKTYKLPEGTKTYGAQSIAFSPDGRYAALAGPSTGPRLRVVDLASSTLILETQPEQVRYVMSVDFSPNGKWLAIGCHANGGQSQIMFWEVASFDKAVKGTPKSVVPIPREGGRGTLQRLVFSPKGNYLAVEDMTGLVRIWSIFDDDETITANAIEQSHQIKGSPPSLRGSTLVFSPDENYIVTAPDENTVGVWEVRSGREVSRIEHQKGIAAIAFSPDGRLLSTMGESVAFWKVEFGSEAQRISVNDKSPEVELKALAISPGGEWLAIASSDGAKVLRTTDWTPVAELARGDEVANVLFSADGRWLITATENRVTAFDTTRWKEAKVVVVVDPRDGLNELATGFDAAKAPDIGFSPDGRTLVVVIGSRVKLFEYGSWRAGPMMKHSDRVRKVSFSPDGRWLAAETADSYRSGSGGHLYLRRERTYVWETKTGLPVACRTDRDDYSQSERSPLESMDNRRAVCPEVKTNQQLALLPEVPNWKQVLESDELASISPDGLWSVEAKYNRDITLSLKDGKTSRQVAGFTPDGSVKDLAFSPDSRWLVIGSDKAVILWPLKAADMIDEACKRLRRRDLTLDEWKRYFSGEKVQPTCAPTQ
jgi:WD40 repeat protein